MGSTGIYWGLFGRYDVTRWLCEQFRKDKQQLFSDAGVFS